MRKQIAMFICLLVFFTAMLCPLYANAATPLDPEAEASLMLHYQKEGQVFSELTIRIYRVAEAFPDGTFELTEPFDTYPVNIHGITSQDQWKHVAVTLESYIVADQLVPYRQAKTDADGTATFAQLETGLYLVSEVVAENNSGTYVFNQFMVYLPTPQADGSYNYAVEAKPKCVDYVPKREYRVTKLWQDAGHQTERPKEVTVDIFKDGKLWETQILSADNNWSYVWYVSEEDHSKWTVAECSVLDAYTVSIQKNGGAFSIINTHESNIVIPDIPPTGDTANLLPYILVMCISGIMMILIAFYGRRRRSV